MKTLRRTLLFACLATVMTAMPAHAQGLGGLIKKAKKVLNATTTTPTAPQTQQNVPSKGHFIELPGGGKMQNGLEGKVDVELVGVYGRSTSLNYGDVYMVIKLRMNENRTTMGIGGNSEWPCTLVDQDGNAYNLPVGWSNLTVTEGVFQKLSMEKKWSFTGVKKTATTVQLARIALSLDYKTKGYLTIKNIPIQWDADPSSKPKGN